MAFYKIFLFFLYMSIAISLSSQEATKKPIKPKAAPLAFRLTARRVQPHSTAGKPNTAAAAIFSQSAAAANTSKQIPTVQTRAQYASTALIATFYVGTPPQPQEMVLDTGSQLSWIQCLNIKSDKKKLQQRAPRRYKTASSSSSTTPSFDASLSETFSALDCNHPTCGAKGNTDFTLPTTCGEDNKCHYSLFYADGTYAEGNLVQEKVDRFPLLTLGCSTGNSSAAADARGILGMNLGRLSLPSQSKISSFSYCNPPLSSGSEPESFGSLMFGPNPAASAFKYVDLLLPKNAGPNYDKLAYTVPLTAVTVAGKPIKVPVGCFRVKPNGSGQTIVDSATEFSYLVEAAYVALRKRIQSVAGLRMESDYVFQGTMDMCFRGDRLAIARQIGSVAFVLEKGVEIAIEKERNLVQAESGVHCLAIGRSDSLGIASNIIGNYHQQNLWVEIDLANKRMGFGIANCMAS